VIEIVGWANVKGDSFDLIDWDINVLRPFFPLSGILSSGVKEGFGGWSVFLGNNFRSFSNNRSNDWSTGWDLGSL